MIRARVAHAVSRDEVDVFLWVDGPDGSRIPMSIEDGRLVLDLHRACVPGSELPVTLRLSDGDYGVLLEALRSQGPLGSVEADALRDTREVRDRLLALVEKLALP